jgi:hypothetical protein
VPNVQRPVQRASNTGPTRPTHDRPTRPTPICIGVGRADAPSLRRWTVTLVERLMVSAAHVAYLDSNFAEAWPDIPLNRKDEALHHLGEWWLYHATDEQVLERLTHGNAPPVPRPRFKVLTFNPR